MISLALAAWVAQQQSCVGVALGSCVADLSGRRTCDHYSHRVRRPVETKRILMGDEATPDEVSGFVLARMQGAAHAIKISKG